MNRYYFNICLKIVVCNFSHWGMMKDVKVLLYQKLKQYDNNKNVKNFSFSFELMV